MINLASNNYLGLASHPRLKEAAAQGGDRSSAPGRGAVRTIAGTMSLHHELERRFAEFKGAEAALMFQSGFTANSGTVAAILSKEDVIVSDRAEPRLDHRRRPAVAGRDQGLRPQGRGGRRPLLDGDARARDGGSC